MVLHSLHWNSVQRGIWWVTPADQPCFKCMEIHSKFLWAWELISHWIFSAQNQFSSTQEGCSKIMEEFKTVVFWMRWKASNWQWRTNIERNIYLPLLEKGIRSWCVWTENLQVKSFITQSLQFSAKCYNWEREATGICDLLSLPACWKLIHATLLSPAEPSCLCFAETPLTGQQVVFICWHDETESLSLVPGLSCFYHISKDMCLISYFNFYWICLWLESIFAFSSKEPLNICYFLNVPMYQSNHLYNLLYAVSFSNLALIFYTLFPNSVPNLKVELQPLSHWCKAQK